MSRFIAAPAAGGVWPIKSTISCIGPACLCRATQGLTITAYRLGFTSVFLALLNEWGLGGPRERLSILADGLRLARTLGQSRGDQKCSRDCC